MSFSFALNYYLYFLDICNTVLLYCLTLCVIYVICILLFRGCLWRWNKWPVGHSHRFWWRLNCGKRQTSVQMQILQPSGRGKRWVLLYCVFRLWTRGSHWDHGKNSHVFQCCLMLFIDPCCCFHHLTFPTPKHLLLKRMSLYYQCSCKLSDLVIGGECKILERIA